MNQVRMKDDAINLRGDFVLYRVNTGCLAGSKTNDSSFFIIIRGTSVLAGCILIRALAKGVFLKNGTLEFSDVAEAARRYAREVEHSDFNKCKMEQMLQDEGKFGLEKLFVIL